MRAAAPHARGGAACARQARAAGRHPPAGRLRQVDAARAAHVAAARGLRGRAAAGASAERAGAGVRGRGHAAWRGAARRGAPTCCCCCCAGSVAARTRTAAARRGAGARTQLPLVEHCRLAASREPLGACILAIGARRGRGARGASRGPRFWMKGAVAIGPLPRGNANWGGGGAAAPDPVASGRSACRARRRPRPPPAAPPPGASPAPACRTGLGGRPCWINAIDRRAGNPQRPHQHPCSRGTILHSQRGAAAAAGTHISRWARGSSRRAGSPGKAPRPLRAAGRWPAGRRYRRWPPHAASTLHARTGSGTLDSCACRCAASSGVILDLARSTL
jgi:hypothetical protein